VSWEVELTDQTLNWLLNELDDEGRRQIVPAIDELEARGPDLGRPFVDRIKSSTHHNMKELRSLGGNVRILFAFDPERKAILLIGGDKTGQWRAWYERNVPIADDLYDQLIEEKSSHAHRAKDQVARRQKTGRKARR
jgi:hypothetical protein